MRTRSSKVGEGAKYRRYPPYVAFAWVPLQLPSHAQLAIFHTRATKFNFRGQLLCHGLATTGRGESLVEREKVVPS